MGIDDASTYAGLTALVVDDDVGVARAMRRFVRELGFSPVLHCWSAAEAVLLAREHQPNLVLTDLVMPEGDFNTIAAIRDITSTLPLARVIVVSGNYDTERFRLSIRAGAVSVVNKYDMFDDLPGLLDVVMESPERPYTTPYTFTDPAPVASAGTDQRFLHAAAASLSPRDRAVLQLLVDSRAQGTADVALDVARRLAITPDQARHQLRVLCHKLGALGYDEAIAFAVAAKIASP